MKHLCLWFLIIFIQKCVNCGQKKENLMCVSKEYGNLKCRNHLFKISNLFHYHLVQNLNLKIQPHVLQNAERNKNIKFFDTKSKILNILKCQYLGKFPIFDKCYHHKLGNIALRVWNAELSIHNQLGIQKLEPTLSSASKED